MENKARHLARELDCFTEDDVAALAGVEVATVRNWRSRRYGPPYITLGNQTLYPIQPGKDWIARNLEATFGPGTAMQLRQPNNRRHRGSRRRRHEARGVRAMSASMVELPRGTPSRFARNPRRVGEIGRSHRRVRREIDRSKGRAAARHLHADGPRRSAVQRAHGAGFDGDRPPQVLANATHASLLPASWATLAVLARLATADAEKLLAEGQIVADMPRTAAEVLVERYAHVPRFASAEPSPAESGALAALREDFATIFRVAARVSAAARRIRRDHAVRPLARPGRGRGGGAGAYDRGGDPVSERSRQENPPGHFGPGGRDRLLWPVAFRRIRCSRYLRAREAPGEARRAAASRRKRRGASGSIVTAANDSARVRGGAGELPGRETTPRL